MSSQAIAKISKEKKILVFVTIILAGCSILYELLLAQTLSTTMGNTILRYNITVGLYMASMGVGAIIYSRWGKDNLELRLVNVEFVLSIIGATGPIGVLVFESMMRKISGESLSYHGFFIQSALFIFNHLLIVAIGVLSGFELPLLMDLGSQIEKKFDMKVLIFDYVGTLIGVILFPLWLLPSLGIFTVAFLIGFLNALVALVVAVTHLEKKKIIQASVIFAFVTILLIFHSPINDYVIANFYFK